MKAYLLDIVNDQAPVGRGEVRSVPDQNVAARSVIVLWAVESFKRNRAVNLASFSWRPQLAKNRR